MQLIGRAEMLQYLEELSRELPDGTRETLVIVGGSMLAIRDLRDATRDIDTATAVSQVLQGAVAVVATRHDLSPRWLNGDAAAFVPHSEVEIVDPDPVLETSTLTVYTATADAVFLMKLFAGRDRDWDDLVALWPLCSFESPQAAADACNRAYDFIGIDDEFLASSVEEIAAAAAAT